jgi:hypothetical protein
MASENLTYAEIGARLGVSPEAARGLSRRLRLPRLRTDDSNKTLVAIDFAEIRHHPTPRHQPADNQADIATLKERITALEAKLWAEQQRSGDYRTDFERERNRADHERERADHLIELRDQLIVELEALRALLEEASGPVSERPWRWWPRRAG